MSKPGNTGLTRIIKATQYSSAGLVHTWRNEAAFRQECIASVLLLPLAFLIGDSLWQVLMLVGCCFLVLIVEILNSAIEAVVDRVGHEHHELAGRAKDMGSAAVMLSIIWLMLVWSSVIVMRLLGA